MLGHVVLFAGLVALGAALPPRAFVVAQPKAQQQIAEELVGEQTLLSAPQPQPPTEEEIAQNQAAHYRFASSVDDRISDLTQHREEIRNGLKVTGMYSYSDGYIMKTVFYEADDQGYRVTGEEVTALAGPKVNLAGTASVKTAAHGTQLNYTVQSVPAEGPVSKVINTKAQ